MPRKNDSLDDNDDGINDMAKRRGGWMGDAREEDPATAPSPSVNVNEVLGSFERHRSCACGKFERRILLEVEFITLAARGLEVNFVQVSLIF